MVGLRSGKTDCGTDEPVYAKRGYRQGFLVQIGWSDVRIMDRRKDEFVIHAIRRQDHVDA